jgi:mannonate dehydratase
MNLTYPNLFLPEESFRWFGPADPVPLAYIRQAGATALFTSLHQIPYGQLWPRDAIRERRQLIEAAGLRWTAVESLPVHESIKSGQGDLHLLFDNYTASLRNLAAEDITLVIYNFMPVLDWVRTDLRFPLPDGSESMRFDPIHLAAFDLLALQRPGAEAAWTPAQRDQAAAWWQTLDGPARETFIRTIIDVFPGVKWSLSLDDIRAMLARYHHIDATALRANLSRFLHAVLPVATQLGIRLAIHPDDPPFPVLGLPRIVSTAADIEAIFNIADTPANGLCFCSGSFSARPDNDLPAMARTFAPRIHALHLRATQLLPDGSFYETGHLAGSVDMPALIRIFLDEQDRRRREARPDWRLPFRPDHGHTMMDDLSKPPGITPGYSAIGRMRGLAELRGLMLGLRHPKSEESIAIGQ